jgi:hypothetical protein
MLVEPNDESTLLTEHVRVQSLVFHGHGTTHAEYSIHGAKAPLQWASG